jgi:Arc/MetJ-type ribon-helix-helix transcriptional regulator
MSIQLTPEQEQRIRTVVNAGAYRSAEEALEAAVAAVEIAALPTLREPERSWRNFF